MAANCRSPRRKAAAQISNPGAGWAGGFCCPYFPERTGRGFWFPSDGANDGDAVVVPQNSLSPHAEIGNEGVPFRCLGLHTHRNAPAEAQARFSEDPAKPLYRIMITTAQPDTTGRLKHNSQNHLNISISSGGVNPSSLMLRRFFPINTAEQGIPAVTAPVCTCRADKGEPREQPTLRYANAN